MGVTVSYKGETIASMNAGGTKTLKTAGKYCEGDITLGYVPDGGVETKKVNFYDFKGNLAHSYTAAEAAELTEMPEAPTIEGFTFQKWNWSLASIKTWLTKHGNDNCDLNVGGLYVTTDGHTRIYMHLREAELADLEMPFCIQQMAGTVVIDWGDNSTPETITTAGVYSHVWQVNQYPADVVIDIEYIPSGSTKLVLGRDLSSAGLFNAELYYASCVMAMHFGAGVNISNGFCRNCKRMEEISISDSITSIGRETFQSCTNLSLIVLPDGITSIANYTFQNCTNLSLIVLPDEITSIGESAFSGCTNLALTVLPDGITSIGNSAFQNCTSLYIIDLTAFTDPQSIPTLANTNAFQGIPAQAQFWVANQEMYDVFTTATNWSTLAGKFVNKGV